MNSAHLRRFVPVLAAYVLIVAATQYAYFGDSMGYVQNIIRFDRDHAAGAQDFWDFGHLLMRPSGWLLYRAFGGLFPFRGSGEDYLSVTALMIAINVLCGLGTALLLRSLAGRWVTSAWAADFIAIAFVCFHAFLNYLHTGTAYVPGLLWMALSLLAITKGLASERQALGYGLLAGSGTALAILYWFPFIFVVPGLLPAAIFWPELSKGLTLRGRVRLTAVLLVSSGVILFAVYLVPIVQLHLYSIPALKMWILSSSHGWSQNRRFFRLIVGMPRSFVWMGDEGLLLKRYLLHDRYAHVTAVQIAGQLWRVLAFYAFAGCLLWVLVQRTNGRQILLILAAAALPVLFFAVFVLEPGSIERYVPIYPFLCVAVAYSFSRFREHRWAVGVIATFLCLAVLLNVKAMWRSSLESGQAQTIARVRSLENNVGPSGVIALLSLRDDLYMFQSSHPFEPEMRHGLLPVYDVIEPGTLRVFRWKQEFARRALEAFQQNSRVWISKRLLALQPLPEWGWTEGDDPNLTWGALRPFFERFQYSGNIGGPDGFVQLTASDENRQILDGLSGLSPAK